MRLIYALGGFLTLILAVPGQACPPAVSYGAAYSSGCAGVAAYSANCAGAYAAPVCAPAAVCVPAPMYAPVATPICASAAAEYAAPAYGMASYGAASYGASYGYSSFGSYGAGVRRVSACGVGGVYGRGFGHSRTVIRQHTHVRGVGFGY